MFYGVQSRSVRAIECPSDPGPLNLLRKLLQSNLSPWRLRGRKFRMWYSPDLIRQPRTLHTVRLSGGRESGAHARRHSRVIRPWRGEWQSSSFSLLIFHFIIIVPSSVPRQQNLTIYSSSEIKSPKGTTFTETRTDCRRVGGTTIGGCNANCSKIRIQQYRPHHLRYYQ